MPAEKTVRFVNLAAQAGARLARRAALINDMYAPVQSQERRLLLEEMYRELDEHGHMFDPSCTSEFCMKAGAMLTEALSALSSAPAQAEGR